jgi:hypothetical protein
MVIQLLSAYCDFDESSAQQHYPRLGRVVYCRLFECPRQKIGSNRAFAQYSSGLAGIRKATPVPAIRFQAHCCASLVCG